MWRYFRNNNDPENLQFYVYLVSVFGMCYDVAWSTIFGMC